MGAFRDFLDELKEAGELNVIEEPIDWDLQAAAICAMAQRTGGPAVQFNNVKDYEGSTLVGGVLAGPGFIEWPQVPRRMHGRIAMALGLPSDTHYTDLLLTVMDRMNSPIRAIEVDSGPCQEEVIDGEDVDLYQYPIPRLHDKDGARYLTFHTVLVRDEEKAWTNLGTYRLGLAGKNALVCGGIPRRTAPSHFQNIVKGYHEKGKSAPFAIVLGPPPELMMAAALSSPEGADEYGIAGGLGLNSIPLLKGQLSDIRVPANAEAVLEGHIYPGDVADEGPFGAVSYYLEKAENNFVFRVESITQRKNPILPFIAESARPSDTMCLFSVLHSAELQKILSGAGLPVKWIILPVEARLCLAIVSLAAQPVPGLQGRVGYLINAYSPFARQVLVVDPDLDSEDLSNIITDRSWKASVERDYYISSNVDKPLGWTENHSFNEKLGSSMLIDATWRNDRKPETMPRRINFEVCFPEDVRKRVISRWNDEWNLSPKTFQYEIK